MNAFFILYFGRLPVEWNHSPLEKTHNEIMPNYIKNKISISLKSEFFSGYLLTSEQNLEYLKSAIKAENEFIMALHRSSTYLLNSCLFVYFIGCVSTMMNVIIDTII